MKQRTVEIAPEARKDLFEIYNWIADAVGPQTALRYIERLETYCAGLALASERGTQRNDIRMGLRTIGFERRATIAFTVSRDHVTILRIFQGGRDWEVVLGNDEE